MGHPKGFSRIGPAAAAAVALAWAATWPRAAWADGLRYRAVGGGGPVALAVAGKEAEAWRVEPDRPLRLEARGGGTLVLHVRADAAAASGQVRFEVRAQGRAQDVRVRARPDPSASAPGGGRPSPPLTTRVILPRGEHQVEVALAAGERGAGWVTIEGAEREADAPAPAPPPATAPPALAPSLESEPASGSEAAPAADAAVSAAGAARAPAARVGGHAELHVDATVIDREPGAPSRADFVRAGLHLDLAPADRLRAHLGLAVEHGGRDTGIEAAHLDALVHRAAGVRAGVLRIPLGFINEEHDPTTFHGNAGPLVERAILPAPWAEAGAGLFGRPVAWFQYKLYGVTGPRATGFGPRGWQDAPQGARAALAEDWAGVLALDARPAPWLRIGAGALHGQADQGEVRDGAGDPIDVVVTLAEAHAEVRAAGVRLRLLGAHGRASNAGHVALAADPDGASQVGSRTLGGYGELAYQAHALWDGALPIEPWARVEWLDAQREVQAVPGRPRDRAAETLAWAAGLAVRPHAAIAVKAEYLHRQDASDASQSPDSVAVGLAASF